MKKLEINEKTSLASGPFGSELPLVLQQLEGRKEWPNGNTLRFHTSEFNLSIVQQTWPGTEVVDNRGKVSPGILSALSGASQGQLKAGFALNEQLNIDPEDFSKVEASEWVAHFVRDPYDFQIACFEKFKDKDIFAIFSEQGTGKTKSAIDIVCYKRAKQEIDALLVLSWPRGVHRQWIDDAMPEHMWKSIKWKGYAWQGKPKEKVPEWLFEKGDALRVFSLNIETLTAERARRVIEEFVDAFGSRCMVIIDESQKIKNANSKRWKALDNLTWRDDHPKGIMTGTPIAVSLVDEWGQFKWLDPDIIGIDYQKTFEAQFCIMGGFNNQQVIAHRNVDLFKRLTGPHIFRATKKELNLPDKVYDEVVFDLSDEQRRLIADMKANLSAEIEDGTITSAKSAIAGIVRIQQISNGFIVDEDDRSIKWLKVNPRIDALERAIMGASRKVVIWARFQQDVQAILDNLGSKVSAEYYGPTPDKVRIRNLEEFKNPDSDVRYLVASPAAAGAGIDGLQKVSSTAVYYSNSYNAIDRWQSEDRLHRIGTTESPTYTDLIARGSMDRPLIRNLRGKKSLADFVLDDVRTFLNAFA